MSLSQHAAGHVDTHQAIVSEHCFVASIDFCARILLAEFIVEMYSMCSAMLPDLAGRGG